MLIKRVYEWGPFLTALGVVALTLRAKRSRKATENRVEVFAGPRQLDGVRKTSQYPSENHMPTHLAELVESQVSEGFGTLLSFLTARHPDAKAASLLPAEAKLAAA